MILKSIFAVALFAPLIAQADSLPTRKAGLWEVTSESKGKSHVIKQCTDSATDSKLFEGATDMAGKMGIECAKREIKKQGATYVSDSDCKFQGSHMVSKGVFTGDFNSQYAAVIDASYTPPFLGMSESKTTISAKWLGACEAGQVPGDIIMPGGMKMNIDQINAMAGMIGKNGGLGAVMGAHGLNAKPGQIPTK